MGNYGFNAQGNRANNYTPNYSAYAQSPYERMYQQMANSQQPQSYASNQYAAQPNNAAPQSQFNGIVSGGANANQANDFAQRFGGDASALMNQGGGGNQPNQAATQSRFNGATANNAVMGGAQSNQPNDFAQRFGGDVSAISNSGGDPNLAAEQAAQDARQPARTFENIPNNIDDIRRNVPSAEAFQNMFQAYQAQGQPRFLQPVQNQQMMGGYGGMLGGAYGNQMGGAQNLANQNMANAYGNQAGGVNNAIMSGGGTRQLVSGLLGKF